MHKLKEYIQQFPNKKILVIGDFCLDEYIHGEAETITPEFNIPWMFVSEKKYTPGAAGNISCGIAALGGQCFSVGVIGEDSNGIILREELKRRGINTEGLISSSKRNTATYTRIVCGGKKRPTQHIARYDIENREAIDSLIKEQIKSYIKRILPQMDAIIVADYDDFGGIGLITQDLTQEIAKLGKDHKKILIGNSRKQVHNFKDFTLTIQNDLEAEKFLNKEIRKKEEIISAAKEIQEKLNLQKVMLTLGKDGILTYEEKEITQFPSKATQVLDVCGAGDTVTCLTALTLSCLGSLQDAAELGNYGASIAVSKEGTVAVHAKEILELLEVGTKKNGKILDKEKLKEKLKEFKKEGKKTVFLNGFFDPLHIGHMQLINEAKKQGDITIIGLNSDKSVRDNKGPDRPFMNEETRAELLASISSVDYITLFDELTPLKIIQEIQPDVLAKGNNYKAEEIVGKEIVESYGGRIALLNVIPGISSDTLLSSMKGGKQNQKKAISDTIKKQNGIIFAQPAIVHRYQYSGRDIIAKNSKFTQGYIDNRGYVPVEWWIMSKTAADNDKPKENEGLSYLSIDAEGEENILFKDAVEIAQEELLGEYAGHWPLTKILDIGGESTRTSFSFTEEIPPIPCHVHSGEIRNGKAQGPGKLEAYFFPPVDIPPYNQKFGKTITRLGLKPTTTKEQVVQNLKMFGKSDGMYELCNIYEINAYDGWTILPGTVHAPGPWTTFEIQRPQDDFNLASWQLGKRLSMLELEEKRKTAQLRGLENEEAFLKEVINWEVSTDPKFKESWYRKSKTIQEGPWGRQLQIFFDDFYGEAFEIQPGYSWTRNADNKPFAGIEIGRASCRERVCQYV